METEKNIADILRYAPKGIKLWDIMHGCQLKFDHVDESDFIVCNGPMNKQIKFCPNGAYFAAGECMIFPDEKVRSWSFWQEYLFKYSVGSVIIDSWCEKFLIGKDYYYTVNLANDNSMIRPESFNMIQARYATPFETKVFFEDMNKFGYKFNKSTGSVTKKKEDIEIKIGTVVKANNDESLEAVIVGKDELNRYKAIYSKDYNKKPLIIFTIDNINDYKTVKNPEIRYNIAWFNTRDEVLVRNDDNERWNIARFSYLLWNGGDQPSFVCDTGIYKQCIPHDNSTENLVGHIYYPPEFYNIFNYEI